MSKKNVDKQNRFRSETIAFRASPQEKWLIEKRCRLYGYAVKQDFYRECCMKPQVAIKDNPLSLVEMRRSLHQITTELSKVNGKAEITEKLYSELILLIEILEAVVEKERSEAIREKPIEMERN